MTRKLARPQSGFPLFLQRAGCNAPTIVLVVGLFAPHSALFAADGRCPTWSAKLVTAEGTVEIQRHGEQSWAAPDAEQTLCAGDKVRTGGDSRAMLALPNQTFVRLKADSLAPIVESERTDDPVFKLIKGGGYFLSRTPRNFKVNTPFVNAAVRGTEFYAEASDSGAIVSVIEGRVHVDNPRGELELRRGESAVVTGNMPPVLNVSLRPASVVQWALHYPALIALTGAPDRVIKSAREFWAGRQNEALTTLDEPYAEPAAEARRLVARAALAMALGSIDTAEKALSDAESLHRVDADVAGLRAVLALVNNQGDAADRFSKAALQRDPESPVALGAASYVAQSRSRLPEALRLARQAVEAQREDPFAWARVAELALANGDRSLTQAALEESLRLVPNFPWALTIQGFTELFAIRLQAAESAFRMATGLQSNLPLARLGLGLTRLRRGHVAAGRRDMEIAVMLDPGQALLRSYLGKAYYEERRGQLAGDQYDLAKSLDSADPTPWFYDAIRKQTENKPVEALRDLQGAIQRNDNRAVYRSRLALDEDLAARGAALGRIYNDLGFGSRGLVEGWEAVAQDPAEFSAHRFLADVYGNLPRHDVARVSELLQSQLLQPLNTTPVQPNLAENRLLTPPATLGSPSFNEFNPAFFRNRVGVLATGFVGDNATLGDELTVSGIYDRTSFSLGQFHSGTAGFRRNNQSSINLYNAFFQAQPWSDLSVQLEARHRDSVFGDVNQEFFRDFDGRFDFSYGPRLRQRITTDTVRTGLHYSASSNLHVLASLIYVNQRQSMELPGLVIEGFNGAYLGEAQGIWKHSFGSVQFGGGTYDSSQAERYDTLPFINQNRRVNEENLYVYTNNRLSQDLSLILGGSYNNRSRDIANGRDSFESQLNPKFGLLWNARPGTLLRLGFFRTVKRALVSDQTLEPTQVAGFNQLFDDINGTESYRYGIGLDQRFGDAAFAGVEVSKRELNYVDPLSPNKRRSDEYQVRTYLNLALTDRWTFDAQHQLEYFQLEQTFTQNPEFQDIAVTHLLPMTFRYFDPSGLFGRVAVTYVNQLYRDPFGAVPRQSSEFSLLDAGVGYRLPGRRGLVTVEMRNILDKAFDFSGFRALGRTVEFDEAPLFFPERTVLAKFTLAFN